MVTPTPLEKNGRGSVPVPDPTSLTTQQLENAVKDLKELLRAEVNTLREVHIEKFNSVEKQFLERDVRTEQSAKDSKVAIDAALQAQKEAVVKQQEASDRAIAKSEAATTKQIDSIIALIAANNAAQDSKANDIKERLTRIDGASLGKRETSTTMLATMAVVIALAGLVFGYGLFSGSKTAAPVVAVVPSVDQAQSAQIAANTAAVARLIEMQRAPAPAPTK
jgi:hypothetical protein